MGEEVVGQWFDDSGSAARFFYTAKASKAERAGSTHPTIKPLALMEYLCKLVTMPENTFMLDPFAGSGTTLVACKKLGLRAVGVELELEHCGDVDVRLAGILVENE
jgi:site-specific DNA-methyltransferase (adenine-specific)